MEIISKKSVEATTHLLLFKPYTTLSRASEVFLGVFAWINIAYIVLTIISMI